MTATADSAPLAGVPPSPERPLPAIEAVRGLAGASRLLERASDELNLAQYRVLAAIAAGDERSSRIAARLAVGKPTVSAMVESLCQRGLLARFEVADDQRAADLHLTAAGRETLGRVEAAMVERVEAVCAHSPDRDQLLQSLVWLGAAIETLRVEQRAGTRP